MVMARAVSKLRGITRSKPGALTSQCRKNFLLTALFVGMVVVAAGCGETTKPVVSPASSQVNSYFGGPFNVTGSWVNQSAAAFDHSANQIAVSSTIINNATHLAVQVPVQIINGSFTSADTGFLGITESFATTSTGVPSAQNPAITGGWAVEIPGVGALANFLSVIVQSTPATASAAPTALVENTACPNFTAPTQFLYVTVPYAAMLSDLADYGIVAIQPKGSAVTFSAQPFLVGSNPQTTSTVSGGCSQTIFGSLTAYPLNTYGSTGSSPELISIGRAGLLVSYFAPSPGSGATSAFGGGTGVIGVAESTSALDVNSVISATYNGFIFSPSNPVKGANGYDITVLASAFGNHTATSQACSVLQSSLAANNNQGGLVPNLPSPNSIYGGEFLTVSAAGSVNDPTGVNGSENCDVAIDLGTQNPNNNGLFPTATVFIGSSFPPFSASKPWTCGSGGVCAVSFPAAAIVGQVQGRYVIFVSASGVSTPPAQLPNGNGILQPQPVGIYLFQRM
jgi:hypothetical protein